MSLSLTDTHSGSGALSWHGEQVGRMSKRRREYRDRERERVRVCSFKRAAERRTCGRCISASSALREKTGDKQGVRAAECPSGRGDKGSVGKVIGPKCASESPTQPCDGGCPGQTGSTQHSATGP